MKNIAPQHFLTGAPWARGYALVFIALVLMPSAVLLSSWWGGDFFSTVLPASQLSRLSFNTLLLGCVVAVVAVIWGGLLAVTISLFDFPGRKVLSLALATPLVVPAYVFGYVMVALAESSWGRVLVPGFREHWGVFMVLIVALYPYAYLFVSATIRAAERKQIDVARALGAAPVRVFGRLLLPMLKRALLAAIAVVFVEVVADFGTVAVFNYDTLTTGIFQAWHGMFEFQAATQLASALLLIAILLIGAEAYFAPKAGADETPEGEHAHYRLKPVQGWMVSLGLWLWLALVMGIPLVRLCIWGLPQLFEISQILPNLLATGALALITAAILVIVGSTLVLLAVQMRDRWAVAAVRLGLLGYGVPGAVLAVGLLIAYSWVGLVGSLLGLVLAYCIRFIGPLLRILEAPARRIGEHYQEAALLLGDNQVIWRVWLPLLRGPIGMAAMLVAIETIKEMPLTLMLRPLGWDTLAVKLYGLTGEGQWERAALPALILVLLSVVPMLLLHYRSRLTGSHEGRPV